MRRYLETLNHAVTEVRILRKDRYLQGRRTYTGDTISGYYEPSAYDQLIKDIDVYNRDAGTKAIYTTLQDCVPELLHRAANRLQLNAKDTTSDHEIRAFGVLPLDIDPKRPAGISSSETELQAAKLEIKAAYDFLVGLGIPEASMAKAMSGNGWHLLVYLKAVENTEENAARFKAVGDLVAEHFRLDTTIYNPSRIWKLYGTISRKGDNTEERPHREAKIWLPEALERMDFADLESKITGALPIPETSTSVPSSSLTPSPSRKSNATQEMTLREWLDARNIPYTEKPYKGTSKFIVDCPHDASHKRDAWITDEGGAWQFSCSHNSCKGDRSTWTAFKAALGYGSTKQKDAPSKAVAQPTPDMPDGFQSPPDIPEAFYQRPKIYTTFSNGVKRPLTDIAKDALDRIVDENENLYHTRKTLGRITLDEHGHHYIETLDNKAIHGYLCDTVNFVTVHIQKTKEGEKKNYVFGTPAIGYSDNILKFQSHNDIRKLRGIYNHPILNAEGQIDFSIGYNAESGIFIPQTAYFERQDMTVDEAKLTLASLVSDFVFGDKTGIFMALALPLTMICRQYINDSTPIFAFSGPSGAGKSLLVKALYRLVTGVNVQEQQTPHTAAEWNKVIFARLLSGEELIYFDNVNRRDEQGNDVELESNALASATTAGLFTDRILGISETRSVEVNSTFAISGIGVDTLISEELFKRIILIPIEESHKGPDEFRYFPLLKHIDANRHVLMSAYMTIIEDWIDAGKPVGLQYLSRFETWAATIGGIFENAGISDAIPTEKTITQVPKPRDRYHDFLRENFVVAKDLKVSVATITEKWLKSVNSVPPDGNFGNLKDITAQKRNQWMREVFPDAEYTKARQSSGKPVMCWKGLAIKR